ncbi:hypothetical protein BH09DEP1_BH09DEP1_4970 [soil metagenome]
MKIRNSLSLLLLVIYANCLLQGMEGKTYQTLLKPELIASHIIPYILHNNGEPLDSLDPLLHLVEAGDFLNNKMVNGTIVTLCAEKYHAQIMEQFEKPHIMSLAGFPVQRPPKESIIAMLAIEFEAPGALRWAAEKYPGDVLELLLQKKDFSTLKSLIKESINPNSFSKRGNAVLINAAWENYSELVEFLLVHKANPNIKNVVGATPLAATAVLRCTNSAQVLLQHGADVDQLCYEENETPLMVAIDRVKDAEYIELVKLFLSYNPDLTIVDKRGRSALDHAKGLKSSYIEGSEGHEYEMHQLATTIGLLDNSWNQRTAAAFLEKVAQTNSKQSRNYLEKVLKP